MDGIIVKYKERAVSQIVNYILGKSTDSDSCKKKPRSGYKQEMEETDIFL